MSRANTCLEEERSEAVEKAFADAISRESAVGVNGAVDNRSNKRGVLQSII